MKITCPKCGHSAEVDDAALPEGTPLVRCHTCGTRFQFSRGTREHLDNLERTQFRCPVCQVEQNQGDACRECGLLFDSFMSGNATPAVRDRGFAMTFPVPLRALRGDNTSSHDPLLQQGSIRKYLSRFAASYSGLMIIAGCIVFAMHIHKVSGLNTGIFLGTVVWALSAFTWDHGRLWNANEKWRLTIGLLSISLAYDLFVSLAVAASDWNARKALAFVVGGVFLSFLRFLALMLFMGPMARRLYAKSITTET